MDCVFCKICDGHVPAMRVHEDGRTLAFMDINPLNDGHCLVIPRAHAPTIFDVELADLQAVAAAAQRVAVALRRALAPDGLHVLQANGAAAFQSVPHFHFHLVPRWTGDGKGLDWPLRPGDRDRIQRTAERIRAELGAEECAWLMATARTVRVLVGKPGLDGHDRGAKIVARALRDAGMEVIYSGLHQTPEEIVATAIQEDVDAIGLSVLSGAHNYLFGRVLELLREQGVEDVVVFGGGIIPPADVLRLKEMGVKALFTPGASTRDIVAFVRDQVRSAQT